MAFAISWKTSQEVFLDYTHTKDAINVAELANGVFGDIGFKVEHGICKRPLGSIGHVGDVAEIIRLAVTNRKNSPNLHDVLVILGKEEVDRRIERALKSLH